MRPSWRLAFTAATAITLGILAASCAGGPPKPGREINLKEHHVHLKLADGWTGEVVSEDWTLWQRVQKGRAQDPWVIPPITVTNTGAGPSQGNEGVKNWRFKGVKGTFNPNVSPLTSAYPVPPGLWSLEPQMLDLMETDTKMLPWPSVSDIQATVRLYENTHGAGDLATLWRTYTVTFNAGPNAYEFVMSIPDVENYRDWMNAFWASIEDFSVDKT